MGLKEIIADCRSAAHTYRGFDRPVEPSRVVEIYERIATSLEAFSNPPASDLEPLFYVKHGAVFQRPVRSGKGLRMGFRVCEICDGINPADVCAILNKGEPPENSENL